MSHTVSSIIAGTPASDAPGGTLTSTNPATGEQIAEVALGDASTFVAACEAARAAQREWAKVPAPVRGRAIQQFGRLVEDNKEALARLVTREIGKPYPESLGEVQEIIDTRELLPRRGPAPLRPDRPVGDARQAAVHVPGAGRRRRGDHRGQLPDRRARLVPRAGAAVRQRGGVEAGRVCARRSAKRWPSCSCTPASPTASSTSCSPTARRPSRASSRALDRGLVDKVGFTGSSAVGAEIGALTGRHLQSATLELGGKNPMVVCADADLDLAVEGALFSGFGTAGQRCTSLGTVIVDEQIHDEFLARFVKATETAAVGDPTEDVLYGPMIHQRFLDRFESEFLPLIADHHEVHGSTGTGRITADNPRDGFVGDADAGLFVHPTIVSGVKVDDDLANTETFGPLVGVAKFGDWEEAIELANHHGYGLSAAIYTTSPTNALRFRERISAGMVSVNNSTSGAEAHLPFGGNGKSGNGSRQSGMWVLDQFTRWQSMNWDYAGKLQKAQMDVADIDADLDFRLED